MAEVPSFDPTQPFEPVSSAPAFDPSKPFEAAPAARVEQTPDQMFGKRVVEMTSPEGFVPTPPITKGILKRAGEGFASGFGNEPIGFSPDTLERYPTLKHMPQFQSAVGLADTALRGVRGGVYGLAGAAAGTAEDLGMSESNANQLQRDLGVVAQYPLTEMPLPRQTVVRGRPRSEQPSGPGAPPAGAAPVLPVAEGATTTLRQFGYPEDLIGSMGADTRAKTAEMLRQSYPNGPGEVSAATAQGATPVQVPRENLGVSLLPAEAAHAPIAPTGGLGARRSAGAAGLEAGPLADVSPQTQEMFKTLLQEQGFTPYTLEQRLGEMSQHEYLGELTPSTAVDMSGLGRIPGAHRNDIHTSVRQRAAEAPERMNAAFDQAFGPNENRAQLTRIMKINRDEAAQPYWQRFRDTEIPPTPQIEALMPRLEAAGALQAANRAMAVEGLPARQGFERLGNSYVAENPMITSGGPPPARLDVPTASAFQAAKEHLDDLIERAMANPGGENEARRYTALKNALVAAIDQHPSVDVANMWKSARDVYAEPTAVMKAMKLGERALTSNIHAEELPFMTASFSPAEMRAFNIGMRGRLEDLAGRPGKTDNTVINTVLAPSNQSKIRWAIGDQKADALIGAIEHEQRMHTAPNRLLYNSVTAEALNAGKRWQPQDGMLENVTLGDITHPIKSGIKRGADFMFAKRAEKKAAEFAKLREEAARLYTLQGPERDAVLRHLLDVPPEVSGQKNGGRVVARAAGGRVIAANIHAKPTEAQKAAGNYAKDHVRIHGLDITIENAKGSKRSGVDKGGKPWSVTMPAHYGYIKGTVGRDKDHVDVYLGPHSKAPLVFVVDQKNAETGAFDEHKCFIGFANKPAVVRAYHKAFSDGKAGERLGNITALTIADFRRWLTRGNTAKPLHTQVAA
jgi:hypothetical protein